MARQADRRQHAIEELARPADEWLALLIFIAARRLADEHDARLRIAVSKDEIGGSAFQRAGIELPQRRRDIGKARACGSDSARIADCLIGGRSPAGQGAKIKPGRGRGLRQGRLRLWLWLETVDRRLGNDFVGA